MIPIFSVKQTTLMFYLLINEMQRKLAYGDVGNAWRFEYDEVDYGYCNGFIVSYFLKILFGNLSKSFVLKMLSKCAHPTRGKKVE